MSLEGLRAWIGEVERKLGKRTRVFLALAVIAIGLGGAAIYLAIDARESSVSESDVQALQEKLETRIDQVAAEAAATPPVEAPAELEPAPPPQTEEKKPEGSNGKGTADGQGTQGEGAGGEPGEGTSPPKGATGGATGSGQVGELVEKAKQKGVEVETAP